MRFECPAGHKFTEVRTEEELRAIFSCPYCNDILLENLGEMDEIILRKRKKMAPDGAKKTETK